MRKTWALALLAGCVAVGALLLLPATGQDPGQDRGGNDEPEFAPGQLIVSFHPGVTDDDIDDFYQNRLLFQVAIRR